MDRYTYNLIIFLTSDMVGLFAVGIVLSWMALLTHSNANVTLSFSPDSAALLVNETSNLTIS